MVPRVTIKGGNLILDIIIPLKIPKKEAVRMPEKIANSTPNLPPNKPAVTILTNETSEPTERSMPFVSITSDIPKVRIANALLCIKIFFKFIILKKYGAGLANKIKTIRNKSTALGIIVIFLYLTLISLLIKSPPPK